MSKTLHSLNLLNSKRKKNQNNGRRKKKSRVGIGKERDGGGDRVLILKVPH